MSLYYDDFLIPDWWLLTSAGVLISVLTGAMVGRMKNRVGFGIVISLLLGPLGVLIVALMDPVQNGRACPFCCGSVPLAASKCCHCGSDLPERIPSVRDRD